jgi:hypothetical protein
MHILLFMFRYVFVLWLFFRIMCWIIMLDRENATFPFPVFSPCTSIWQKRHKILNLSVLCNKTNLMHYLSSVYFVMFRAYLQSIIRRYTIYIQQLVRVVLFSWLTVGLPTEKHNTYQLLYICNIPPNDGLQIWPKHEALIDEINWG